MIIPYRSQQILRRLGITLLSLMLLLVVLLLCWFLWLQRYIVYTGSGAKLDFDVSLEFSGGETAQKPKPPTGSDLQFTVGSNLGNTKELVQFSGYRVTLDALKADLDGVKQAISALPKGTTVLLELKTIKGEFAYTSTLGPSVPGLDSVRVDELLVYLKTNGYYTIAQIPAFLDYEYFMADRETWSRNAHGLAKKGGNGSLWPDTNNQRCFWFNPANDGARSFLIQIISELRSFGLNEVAFSHFQFPDTDQINFTGDRFTALTEAADFLVKTGATESFAVSFIREDANLPMPRGRTRLYLTGISAGDVATLAGKADLANTKVQLVFFADTNDTRFDEYSVLRPLDMAR